MTLKQIEKTEVAKTKSDKQKTDVEEVRDPNANYYMCIGSFYQISLGRPSTWARWPILYLFEMC